MFIKCLFLVGVWIAAAHGECGPCATLPKHYEELGCKGVKENEDDCCPIRFECPNFLEFDKTKCNFQGKAYDVGAVIAKDTHKLPTCTVKCTCKKNDDIVGFECDYDNCPEAAEQPKPDCTQQYTLDSCCAVKQICKKEEIEKLATCHFEGKQFFDGNLIYPPKEPCYKCICNEKFDNSTAISKNSNCKRVDCGIEIHAILNFQEGCAPVYFSDNYCCPVEFRCPNEKDAILPGKGKAAADLAPELTCKYGGMTLGLHQEIKLEDKCLGCGCNSPPVAQCTRVINTDECH